MLEKCADKNFYMAFYGTLVLVVANLSLLTLSWIPFTHYLSNTRYWNQGSN
jgi:hypothetical protein